MNGLRIISRGVREGGTDVCISAFTLSLSRWKFTLGCIMSSCQVYEQLYLLPRGAFPFTLVFERSLFNAIKQAVLWHKEACYI